MAVDYNVVNQIHALWDGVPKLYAMYEEAIREWRWRKDRRFLGDYEPRPTKEEVEEAAATMKRCADALEDSFERLRTLAGYLVTHHQTLADSLRVVRWTADWKKGFDAVRFDDEMSRIDNAVIRPALKIVTINNIAHLAKLLGVNRQRASGMITAEALPRELCNIREQQPIHVPWRLIESLKSHLIRRKKRPKKQPAAKAKVSTSKEKRPKASVRKPKASVKRR